MPRYRVAATTFDWDVDVPLIPSLSVDGSYERDTGLVDQHGNKIMRIPASIGFHAEID